MAAQGQARALNSDVPEDPPSRGLRRRLGRGRLPGAWERVPRAYRKCHSFSDFWKAYVAVLPEETHRSVGQGDRGDRAHEALVQNPVPAHCALRPRDPLLLQEKLVARDRVDPLVHRRVQPLMLRVARIGA